MTNICLRLLFRRRLQRAWDVYHREAVLLSQQRLEMEGSRLAIECAIGERDGLLLRCMGLEAEIAQLAGHDAVGQRAGAPADVNFDGLADVLSARLLAVLAAADGETAVDPRGGLGSGGAARSAGRVAFAHEEW